MSDLFHLITALSDEVSETSAEALLRHALAALKHSLPAVRDINAYRLAKSGLVLWISEGAEDESQRFTPFSQWPAYQQAVESPVPVRIRGDILVPLHVTSEPWGLLVLKGEDLPDPAELAWLMPYARQLALSLDNRHLHQLIHHQTQAFNTLRDSTTFEEIALAIAQSMTERGQFASINIFGRDEDEQITGARVVVTANRQQAIPAQEDFGMTMSALAQFYENLDAQADWLIPDIENDPGLDETSRTWLRRFRIKAVYNLPLRWAGTTFGFIAINETQGAFTLSQTERRIFRNIGEQVSIAIHNRNLLTEAQGEARSARTLFEMSAMLMAAGNIPDILRVVRDYAAQAATIRFVEIAYEGDDLASIIVRHSLMQDDATSPDQPLHETLSPAQRTALLAHWQQVGSQLEIMPDLQSVADAPLSASLVARDFASGVMIPIVEDTLRRGQLDILWDAPRLFTRDYAQLLEAAQVQITLALRSRQFLRATQLSAQEADERTRILRLINELNAVATIEQDETRLLDVASHILRQATGADHIGIALLEPDNIMAQVVAESPAKGAIGLRVSSSGELFERAANAKQPIVIADIASDQTLQPDTRQILLDLGNHSILIVPVLDVSERLLGTVGFDIFDDRPIDAKMIANAEAIVEQLEINLQKIRLLSMARRQAAQLNIVNLFAQSAQSAQSVSEIVRQALTHLRQMVPLDALHILQRHSSDQTLRRPLMWEGGEPTLIWPGTYVAEDESNTTQYVLQTGQHLHIANTEQDASWQHPLRPEQGSLLVLPVRARGVVQGAIAFSVRQRFAYTEADIATLEQFVNQYALALNNAEAYAQSQRTAQKKAQANEIAALLQQQIDIDSILNVTVHELGRAIGARRGRIRLGVSAPDEPTP